MTIFKNKSKNRVLCLILVSTSLDACSKISPLIDEFMAKNRMDLDGDGILRPLDCDDHNPKIGIMTFWRDLDHDGFGGVPVTTSCILIEDLSDKPDDCDDGNPNVNPDAEETCDKVDNNCNDQTDEEVTPHWCEDADSDGYGNSKVFEDKCDASEHFVGNCDDCDDKSATIKPSGVEICNNGIDENCNDVIDDAIGSKQVFRDSDHDGYGDKTVWKYSCNQAGSGDPAHSWVFDSTDCDDKIASTHPKASEICENKIDDNCDGITDTDAKDVLWYKDGDGDHYGNPDPKKAKLACKPPDNSYVDNPLDCLDSNESVHPGVDETCNNGTDDNCDGSVNQCNLNVKIDLNNTDVLFKGEKAEDLTGYSVATIAHPEKVGSDNVLVGAPQNSKGGSQAGTAYVMKGPIANGVFDLGKAFAQFVGEAPGDRAGYSVASCDVNGDGEADIIIGAPFNSEGGTQAGAVYIFYGPFKNQTLSLDKADVKLIGEASEYNAGWSVTCGDTNSDGIDDVILGAPHNGKNEAQAGKAYILFGPIFPGKISLNKANVKLIGEADGDLAGYSVAFVGDVNNDQIDDVIVGACHNSEGGYAAGAAYILFGPLVDGVYDLAKADVKFVGEKEGDFAGFTVGSAGDIDHDAYRDILVGAIYQDEGALNAGAVYGLLGPLVKGKINLKNASFKRNGEYAGDNTGWSFASNGDVNHDGIDDIVTGVRKNSSNEETVFGHIFYGPIKKGTASMGSSNIKLFTNTKGPSENFTVSFCFGSFNKDNASDLLTGINSQNSGAKDPGTVSVIFGKGL